MALFAMAHVPGGAGRSAVETVADTGKATVYLEGEWLIRTVYKPGVTIELEDAETEIGIYRGLTETRTLAIVIDLRAMKTATSDARARYASDEDADLVCATALLTGSAVSRVIGNFYLTLNKPASPTKLFTNEALAIEWLREMHRG